jgi:hypothetical protein
MTFITYQPVQKSQTGTVIRDRLLTEHHAIRASVATGLQAFVDKCRREVEQYERDNR